MTDKKIICPHCGKTIMVMMDPVTKSFTLIGTTTKSVLKGIKNWFK
jgi:DNA-directed RNA polymerase subunit RPC12/RpoP